MAKYKGSVAELVPEAVEAALEKKFAKNERKRLKRTIRLEPFSQLQKMRENSPVRNTS